MQEESNKSTRGMLDPEESITILRNFGNLKTQCGVSEDLNLHDLECSLAGTQEEYAV